MTINTNIFLYSILILFGTFISSCRNTTPKNKAFVSETFQNRFVDDGTTQIHDQDDQGFYTNHFSIEKVIFQHPDLITETELTKNTNINWSSVASFDSVLNFKNFLSPNINRVVYVIEYVFEEDEISRLLSLGSDDGIKIWVNSQEIYSRNKWRGLRINDDLVQVDFREGWNTIVYKVSQGGGGWGLYRKLQNPDMLESIIRSKISDIYNDILETVIIGSEENLRLKIDPRSEIDSFNNVGISLHQTDKDDLQKTIFEQSFIGKNIPEEINIPTTFSGVGLFTIEIRNNAKVLFKEEIPVFSKRFVEEYYNKLFDDLKKDDELFWAKKNGFKVLYEKGKESSTRLLAEALRDVLEYQNEKKISHGFNVLGYRSEFDQSIQTYTLFSPSGSISKKAVIIMHGEYDKDSDYWYSYEGGSHATTTNRIASSIRWNLNLIMTHGRGIQNYLGEAEEELPLISKQLSSLSKIKASHILVWSKGTTSLLELLKTADLNLHSIGLISPFVPDNKIEMQQLISYIKVRYPELKWFIRHGLNDADSPISRTRKFVELLRKNNFKVDYEEIPYSTHWNYIYDQEHEYYKYVLQN
ncbi:MAG: hypothetical protein ABJK11_09320 [Balneola sp.]